jgi:hypothetical protein
MSSLGKHQAFFEALRAVLTRPGDKIQNLDQFDDEIDKALNREAMPSVLLNVVEPISFTDEIAPTIPKLLPDEILQGWRGRVAALNSLSKISQVETLLRSGAQNCQAILSDDPDFVECAAVVLGVDRQQLMRRHTLLPFFEVLEGLKENKPGTKSERHLRAYLRQAPFRIEGKEALFCQQCVEEDLAFKKYSYWRRSHHLPGVHCCSKHGSPLLVAGGHEAFDFCPHFYLNKQTKACLMPQEELAQAVLLRYSQIAADILDCSPTIDSASASVKLGRKAKAAGLRISRHGQRKTSSTNVMELLPVEWLQKTFPRVKWKMNKYISTFDGACSPRAARYTTAMLCLHAAVLYESADEALSDLLSSLKDADRKEHLGFDFWASKEMLELYVECDGIVSHVAERLGLPTSTVGVGLLNQGLPGLGKSAGLRTALKAIYAGENFNDTCQKANVSHEKVEAILRAGGRRLAIAVKMMASKEVELIQ